MLLFTPSNLDLPTLVKKDKPNFSGFKIDFLYYIIHQIFTSTLNKNDNVYHDYIPLSSRNLQYIKINYKDHLDYLIKHEIISCNNSYSVKKQSKGYMLNENYWTQVKTVEVCDYKIRQKLKCFNSNISNSIPYISKWMNNSLEIDMAYVSRFAFEVYELKKNKTELWDTKRITPKDRKGYLAKKKPHRQYISTLLSGLSLDMKQWRYKRDSTVGRLHTNLTNMPSIIRNVLTYKSESLVNIDIKNSQPYLVLVLLNMGFWIKNFGCTQQEKLSHSKTKPKNFNNTTDYKGFTKSLKLSNSQLTQGFTYTMLLKILQTIDSHNFDNYIGAIMSGRFYEVLRDNFSMCNGGKEISEKEVKEAVFQVLFTSNRFIGQEEAKNKRLFKRKFPSIMLLFELIKSQKKELLPCLLQAIESHLILDVICKRISIEFPDAPIFPIHDSIATTQKYADEVERIMFEELNVFVGHKPILKREYWRKENMDEYIQELRFKSKDYLREIA